MAWSETMYMIQHLDEKIESIESKLPIVAKSINGLPEGVDVQSLKPGAIWYIEEDDLTVKYFRILNKNKIFCEPIPLNVEWN